MFRLGVFMVISLIYLSLENKRTESDCAAEVIQKPSPALTPVVEKEKIRKAPQNRSYNIRHYFWDKMDYKAFFVTLMLLQKASSSYLSPRNTVIRNPENISQHCVCVPYWQCKDDFSGLIADGIDILDVRVLRNDGKAPPPCTGDFDVCCQIECGRSNYKKSSGMLALRILGEDNEAKFSEFPWMLGILKDQIYLCGASLIHPQAAITAAHCVTGRGQYIIRAGEWNWEKQDEPLPFQEKTSDKVIIHPDYHPASLRNDIALIILQEPFKLAENVGTVCLPRQGSTFNRHRCTASGWGKNSFEQGTYQTTLKKIDLPIIPHDLCLYSLQDARLGPYFQLHYSFICAGGEKHRDTCKGDGGSPLVCPVSNDGRYEQAGIVSWGLTCGVKNTPGVYVNVALFIDWIDGEMLSHNFDVSIYKRT